MKEPLRIGLLMQGGDQWIAGIEYTKNIILALESLPQDIRSSFELCLICQQPTDLDSYDEIKQYVNEVYYLGPVLKSRTPFKFILQHLMSATFIGSKSGYDGFLRKARIDFAFPYSHGSGMFNLHRSAAWIPDFQHKYLPQFFSEQEIKNRDKAFAAIADRSYTVVLSSETAKADFQKFFPEAAHKAEVLSFRTCSDPTWYETKPEQTIEKYSLPERFFLISNQFWQHKNHLLVFKALKLLQRQSLYPIVVCTGHTYDYRRPDYFDAILCTINRLDIAHQVYLLGLIPRFDQIQLMRASLAIIQPSLFEGWSTVVEDARCLGKASILSDIPVHREQDPPYNIFFQSDSAEHLATVLAECWKTLPPGPHPENEASARKNNRGEVQAFGYRFLEIAKGS